MPGCNCIRVNHFMWQLGKSNFRIQCADVMTAPEGLSRTVPGLPLLPCNKFPYLPVIGLAPHPAPNQLC